MTRTLFAAALILFSTWLTMLAVSMSVSADECKPTQPIVDHLKSQGFKVYELPEQWKADVLAFEKQHQGPRVTDFLESVRSNPWYAAYQGAAMLGEGPGRRGAFFVSDKDKQCLVFSQDLSGDVVYHVLKGDW
jgi:hypothetical protein